MIRCTSTLLLVVAMYSLQGQSLPGLLVTDLPNLPPAIGWQQIKSPHFKIIYPQYLEREAQRTANILEHIYEPASESIGASSLRFPAIKRFPIVLQSEYAQSNGFVTVAPYRSEFFTFSPQNYRSLGNDEWLAHLAVHEYRHIAQFKKAITPFNMLFFLLAGETGVGGISALAAPAWFFEGDAVGIETAMGHTGRGRTPSFLMAYKANLIEKGGFNYYKQYLRSFRDFVPNHYVTGYLMTTYLKNKYGANIWDPIIGKAFRTPFIPFNFSNAIKKYTGNYLVPTYHAMQQQQKELYRAQLSKITPTPFYTLAHRPNRRYTDYLLPQEVFGGHVLAVKTGFADIPQFVLLNKKGKETKLHHLGFWNNSGVLSATDTLVVWAEQALDSRWQRRTYSVIKKLNLKTRKLTRLTKTTKYVSPALSPDGEHIVAIRQSPLGQCNIHWLDAQSGEVMKMLANPTHAYYAMPSVNADGKSIVCLKQQHPPSPLSKGESRGGKAIVKINISTGEEQELYYSATENLGSPLLRGDRLYYATDGNGIDNIYALDLGSGQRYQVTSSRYGAFAPALSRSGDDLIYNEYTADGFEVAYAPINPSAWTKAEDAPYVGIDFQKEMVESEHKEEILYQYPDSVYRTKKYHKFLHSIRPHSWSILPLINNSVALNLTATDLLGSTQITLGGIYHRSERNWRGSALVSYQAWYPIIDVGYEFGRRTALAARSADGKRTIALNWHENIVKLGLRVPFYLTNSAYLRKISLGASYHAVDVRDCTVLITENTSQGTSRTQDRRDGLLQTLNYTAAFTRLLRRSKLDLNPRWGQTLRLSYRHTILPPRGPKELIDYFSIKSELLALSSNLYFPGIFRHHSLHLKGAYQYQKAKDYYFLSAIPFARGFPYYAYERLTTLSLNYALPLAYMDWHLGPILNLQRIYAHTFYDLTIGKNPTQSARHFRSLGAEVWWDVNLFRLLPLLSIGVRYSHIPETNSGLTELLLGSVRF